MDISASAVERAKVSLASTRIPLGVEVDFVPGSTDALPFPDGSFDTLLAFDCLEHVMSPEPILREWHRVLRPGGRCLIEWYPYKGPWGPHMESLVPIPWAHVIFGERAIFRTAEAIYDLPEFVPDIGTWMSRAERELTNGGDGRLLTNRAISTSSK